MEPSSPIAPRQPVLEVEEPVDAGGCLTECLCGACSVRRKPRNAIRYAVPANLKKPQRITSIDESDRRAPSATFVTSCCAKSATARGWTARRLRKPRERPRRSWLAQSVLSSNPAIEERLVSPTERPVSLSPLNAIRVD